MTVHGPRNALADKTKSLTLAQARTLSVALTAGKVYLANNPNGRVDPRSEVLRRTADQLVELGHIRWVAYVNRSLSRMGYYMLTDAGRSRALKLPDRESSASRQYWIETGRYLPYSERPEFQ
jgi:hypothetical protein